MAARSRLMPPSAHSMRQSPGAISGSASTTRHPSKPLPRMVSSSRSRAPASSWSLTHTTTCGAATRCRKQSAASAAISAYGSRAMSSDASFLATATATSTASVSSRASTADSPRARPSSAPEMRSSVAAARCSASSLAAAKPSRKLAASASASLAACSTSVSDDLLRSLAAKSLSNRNFAGDLMVAPSPSIDQLFVAVALGDHDLALGRKVLREIDELGLRLVDVSQPHRPERRHVVGEHLGGAGRHVAEEELADGVGGALERDRQLVLVDVAHERLRRSGIETREIVEGEHQGLDALGAVAALVLERGHEAGLGLQVEKVEDFGHHFVSVAAARLRQVGHEFGAQGAFDPLDHLLLHRLHLEHAVDHVERQIFGQDGEHPRRVLRPDLAQHHGDGLRIFVL